jgi:hypothetical protein
MSLNKLENAWKLKTINIQYDGVDTTHYISSVDYDKLKNKLLMPCYYQTNILPQPFFGNIESPEIIVLAKNPKYEGKKSVDESEEIINKSSANYPEDIFLENRNKYFENNRTNHCTLDWWKKSFCELIGDKCFEDVLDNVGIFNLCGYHSKNYFDLPKKIRKDIGEEILPSQEALKEHLNKLINAPTTKLVIIIWGEKPWRSFLDINYDEEKLLIVNEEKQQNPIIKYAKKYNHFKELISECLNYKG